MKKTDCIKLPRSLLTPEILADERLCRLFLNLLARTDSNGSVTISLRSLANELHYSYQTMRTMINRLLLTQTLTQAPTQRLTRLSLCGSANKTIQATQTLTQTPTRRFLPPTDEEVRTHVIEMGYHFDPDSFVPHYRSKGWKIGKDQMRDWKAACRTWEISWRNKHGNLFYHQLHNETDRKPTAAAKTSRDRMRGLATEIVSNSANLINLYNGHGIDPDHS